MRNNVKKILALCLVLIVCVSAMTTAMAAPVAEATIDTTKTGSLTIYKYDLTNGATRS